MSSNSDWSIVIVPHRKLFSIGLRDLWAYRYLVPLFVRRDLRAAYIQTVLGPVWLIIPPLINSVTFTIIFGRLANLSADGAPHFLFYMSGVVMWGFFSTCVTGNANTFASQVALFNKVYFPRLIVPIANTITAFVSTLVQFVILILFIVYSSYKGWVPGMGVSILALPVLFVSSAAVALGVGSILSAITARYRDLGFLLGYVLQIWMYATTVIYPLSSIPEKYQLLAQLNPMTPIIETFRHAVLGVGSIPWVGLAMALPLSFFVFFVGVTVFNAVEKTAMDTV